MKRFRTAFVVLAILVSALLAPAQLQQLDERISAADRRAIIAASAFATQGDSASELLSRAGYAPPATPSWTAYPPVRKFETAYLSAEQAEAGGGRRLLARLSTILGESYPVRAHPVLQPLLAADDRGAIRFRALPLSGQGSRVADAAVQTQILAISRYADSGAMGGAQGVLQFYFQLPDHVAYDILRTSDTTADALQRAWNYVPEAERKPALSRLVRDLDAVYPTVRRDASLREYLIAGRSPATVPPPIPLPPSTSKPAVSGLELPKPTGTRSAELRTQAAQGYLQFLNDLLKRTSAAVPPPVGGGGGLSFGRMVGTARGFGGVVVGNRVSGSATLGRPEHVMWMGKRDGVGRVEVTRSGGAPLVFPAVSAEEAIAAARIVFTGVDTVPAFGSGEGVGLVGVTAGGAECDDVDAPMRWFTIVMHPGIADLALGRTVLAADTLPISERRAELDDQLRAGAATAAGRQLTRLFSDYRIVTWKVIDRETRIDEGIGGLVVVNAMDGSPTVLGMNGFRRDDASGEPVLIEGFGDKFAPIAEQLAAGSDTYTRLNHFLKVLALFRWARDGGARWDGDAVATPVNPAGSVLLSNGRAYLAVSPKLDEARRELQARLAVEIAKSGAVAGQFAQFKNDLDEIGDQIHEADRAATDAWIEQMRARKPAVFARYQSLNRSARESVQILRAPTQDEAVRDRAYRRLIMAATEMESLREANPVAEDRALRQLRSRRAALFARLGNLDTMRWTASCLAGSK